MHGTALAVAAALAAGCTSTSGQGGPSSDPPAAAAPAYRLIGYDSCDEAMAGLRAAALRVVGPYGFAVPPRFDGRFGAAEDSAAVPQAPAASRSEPAPDHSGTTVQEDGVDEPDLVKTDGRRIVTVANRTLRVIDVASHSVTGTLRLPIEATGPYGPGVDLLLHADLAMVLIPNPTLVYGRGPMVEAPVGRAPVPPTTVDGFRLLLVHLGPADVVSRPRLVSTLRIDGAYVDARQVGGTVRVVVRSAPRLRFAFPSQRLSFPAAAAHNRGVVRRSTPADWLPRYVLDRGDRTEQGQVPCDRLSHPAAFTGSNMLTVYTFDLGAAADQVLGAGDPVTIAADGDTVYGSARSLYITSASPWQTAPRTQVYRFEVTGPGRPRYVAAGEVPGGLLNRYALSEYDGRLRVATTTTTAGRQPGDVPPCCETGLPTQSAVRVLEQRGDTLVEVGTVDGLGRGERIYAVRFLGPVGYVVTFRQMDPLYTLDLRDPRRPRVVGELKITGYSAYLHPAGGDRLIGVGQDATEHGGRLGTQVSLFDVSDAAHPTRLAAHRVSHGYSEVETDPHAFLYWPATGLVVVPVTTAGPDAGALALQVRGRTLYTLGSVNHGAGIYGNRLRRALVIGDTLWTLSSAGLQANDAATLAQRAWLPFS